MGAEHLSYVKSIATFAPTFYGYIKDWPGKKVTILKSRLLMVKSSEIFFYLHFTSLYGHKIIKEFFKNIHF